MLPVVVSPAALTGAAAAGESAPPADGAPGFAAVLAEACGDPGAAPDAAVDDADPPSQLPVDVMAIWPAAPCISRPELDITVDEEEAAGDGQAGDRLGDESIDADDPIHAALPRPAGESAGLPAVTEPSITPPVHPADEALDAPAGETLAPAAMQQQAAEAGAPGHADAESSNAALPGPNGRATGDRQAIARPVPGLQSSGGEGGVAAEPVTPATPVAPATVEGKSVANAAGQDGHEALDGAPTWSAAPEASAQLRRLPGMNVALHAERGNPAAAGSGAPAAEPSSIASGPALTAPAERSVRDGHPDDMLELDMLEADARTREATERVTVPQHGGGRERGEQPPRDPGGSYKSGDRGTMSMTLPGLALLRALDGGLTPGLPLASTPSPSGAPTAQHETFDQLVQTFRLMVREGITEARVRLRPEHLGDVTIAIRVDGRSVTATVVAESESVCDWLNTQEDVLRSSLSQHGLTLDRLLVQRDARHERREHEPPQPRRPRQNRNGEGETRFDVSA